MRADDGTASGVVGIMMLGVPDSSTLLLYISDPIPRTNVVVVHAVSTLRFGLSVQQVREGAITYSYGPT